MSRLRVMRCRDQRKSLPSGRRAIKDTRGSVQALLEPGGSRCRYGGGKSRGCGYWDRDGSRGRRNIPETDELGLELVSLGCELLNEHGLGLRLLLRGVGAGFGF
jgi:hypothetical protein